VPVAEEIKLAISQTIYLGRFNFQKDDLSDKYCMQIEIVIDLDI